MCRPLCARLDSCPLTHVAVHQDPVTGEYLTPERIEALDEALDKGENPEMEVAWEKMSKSKHNGIDPTEVRLRCVCATMRQTATNGRVALGVPLLPGRQPSGRRRHTAVHPVQGPSGEGGASHAALRKLLTVSHTALPQVQYDTNTLMGQARWLERLEALVEIVESRVLADAATKSGGLLGKYVLSGGGHSFPASSFGMTSRALPRACVRLARAGGLLPERKDDAEAEGTNADGLTGADTELRRAVHQAIVAVTDVYRRSYSFNGALPPAGLSPPARVVCCHAHICGHRDVLCSCDRRADEAVQRYH